ncbi:MAG TPA: hypothetical protein VK155_01315 [Bacteroidales bacterium]|jgi:hypothetical protein|nr:hypothetical protein [Bacteroidales bacterium]
MQFLLLLMLPLPCTRNFIIPPEVIDWISGPFYKVICKVSDNEFENAKRFEDNVILTESSLDNLEVAIHPGKESCLIS